MAVDGLCRQHGSSKLAIEYAERVEEALGLEGHEGTLPIRLPTRSERRVTTEPVKVSFGQWYQLEDCEAGRLIAQANNALGRVRSAFERVRHNRSLLL